MKLVLDLNEAVAKRFEMTEIPNAVARALAQARSNSAGQR